MNSFDEVVRVAVVAGGHHGGTSTRRRPAEQERLLQALRSHPIPGFRVDVLEPGSGMTVEPHHDLIHLLSDDDAPSIVAVAREHDIGLVAASPTVGELVPAADLRLILSPSAAADRQLLASGTDPALLWRWQPGVDPEEFGPGHYREGLFGPTDGRVNVICAGDPEQPGLVLEAFTRAAELEPQLRLHLVGSGPATRLALGSLRQDADVITVPDGRALAHLYASAELLLYSEAEDASAFPLTIREAQASGLPVLAVDRGAASELIEDGRDGCLVPATVPALAEALRSLARRATLRERLAIGGLNAVRGLTWSWALDGLAAAWSAALAPAHVGIARAA